LKAQEGAPPASFASPPGTRPTVVVPAQTFRYTDRKRHFYKVAAGDTLRGLASALAVTADELCRWNTLAADASLQEGMILRQEIALDRVALLPEDEARILVVGTEEFFAHFEGLKGRKRLEIVAREGDSFRTLAKRYGLSLGTLERINQRSRSAPLTPGDKLVVYVDARNPGGGAEPDGEAPRGELTVAATTPGLAEELGGPEPGSPAKGPSTVGASPPSRRQP
jgi:membrane-bound lytic murein transglycosylase D